MKVDEPKRKRRGRSTRSQPRPGSAVSTRSHNCAMTTAAGCLGRTVCTFRGMGGADATIASDLAGSALVLKSLHGHICAYVAQFTMYGYLQAAADMRALLVGMGCATLTRRLHRLSHTKRTRMVRRTKAQRVRVSALVVRCVSPPPPACWTGMEWNTTAATVIARTRIPSTRWAFSLPGVAHGLRGAAACAYHECVSCRAPAHRVSTADPRDPP